MIYNFGILNSRDLLIKLISKYDNMIKVIEVFQNFSIILQFQVGYMINYYYYLKLIRKIVLLWIFQSVLNTIWELLANRGKWVNLIKGLSESNLLTIYIDK